MVRSVPDFNAERRAAARYYARWKQMAVLGNKPVIITKRDDPAQWSAWLTYYRLQGLVFSVELMADRHEMTVPCSWPQDFDAGEVQADRRMKD